MSIFTCPDLDILSFNSITVSPLYGSAKGMMPLAACRYLYQQGQLGLTLVTNLRAAFMLIIITVC